MELLDIIALFILLAGVFIFINTYFLKLPSSVGLMIMALVLSVVTLIAGAIFPEFKFHTEELVEEYNYAELLYQLVLSLMLFAGALQIDFRKLSKEKTPVLILASTGVLLSTGIIGTAIYYLLHLIGIFQLDYIHCLVFGALISPTDPIAITKTLKHFKISRDLEIRISGESLFNDGFAVVLALLLLDLASAGEGHDLTTFEIIYVFATDIGGGIVIGLFLGYLGYRILQFVDNEEVEVEILVTLAMVMVGSQLAEFIHFSAKQAAVIMGLVIGNEGRSSSIEGAAGDYLYKFWMLIEESLNAMLFVLIGLEMLVLPFKLDYFAAGLLAFNIVLIARWISVTVPLNIMARKRKFENHTIPILTWGAIRGGLPIALSLSLPDFEGKSLMLTMTYIVVVISILYQGLTIPRLIRSLRFKNQNP